MASIKMRFETTTDMFGVNIDLVDKSGEHRIELVRGLQVENPFSNMKPSLRKGYMFRRPNMPVNEWEAVFTSLAASTGPYHAWTVLSTSKDDKDAITAYVRFSGQDDAALWAWTHGSTWQKWSDELEKASKVKTDQTAKIFVDEDGKVKARVTVSTLDK